MSGKEKNQITREDIEKAIAEDVWPLERDFLSRPERFKYVRKLVKPKGCVFCQAVKTGVSFDSLLLTKGEYASVLLNKYPYNNGHLLVIPNDHCGDFTELPSEVFAELHQLLRKSVDSIKKAYGCDGMNLGMNLGHSAGAGIPEHLHYHVIPRWVGDTNFFPVIAETKVIAESLEQVYDRLLPYFESK